MKEREYTIIACQDEDGGYWTDVPALPGTGSQGDILEEAIENTKEAIALMLEYLRDKGAVARAGAQSTRPRRRCPRSRSRPAPHRR